MNMLSEVHKEQPKVVLSWNDYKHCEEIQEDCFLKAIDDYIEKDFKVTAAIPKSPETIDWVFLKYLLERDCRIVIE